MKFLDDPSPLNFLSTPGIHGLSYGGSSSSNGLNGLTPGFFGLAPTPFRNMISPHDSVFDRTGLTPADGILVF